jgi:hypothetical protein
VATQTIYTRKGDEVLIENSDKSKPEPINIVDLTTKKLTIVYPHNSTFVVVPLTTMSSVAGVGDPGGRVPGASMPVGPGSTIPATTPRIGPAIAPPPGFSTPPPMPSMPPMPPMPDPAAAGLMAGPQRFGPPGMPPMAGMGGFGAAPELKKTDKTRKIQGLDCVLYTLSDRRETFEIWATPDSGLFPFRLIQMNYQNRRFGPRMLEEQWVEFLQKQSLFPLEATLRAELPILPVSRGGASPTANSGAPSDPGPPQFVFKVDKIERTKIDNEKLFQPPDGYLEIQSPAL